MDRTLRGVVYARCYIDDIIMYSENVKVHMGHVRAVLKLLDSKGLRVHLGKCMFRTDTIDFLGYKLTGKGLEPLLEKTKAMREMPTPKDLPSLRTILGLFTYCRKFVGHFSSIAALLNALLKGVAKWEWGESQEHAFPKLKEALCSESMLRRPDFGRKFLLSTDKSRLGI